MITYQETKQSRLFELRPKAYAYGYSAGILQLDADVLPIPGDINNATTFGFPVLYASVPGATAERVAAGDPNVGQAAVDAAKALVDQGVRFIAADSGLFASYQAAIAAAVPVPVIHSLSLLPIIAEQFLGGAKTLCVLTADATTLTTEFLKGVGLAAEQNVVIAGLQAEPAFREQILGNADVVDSDVVEAEVVAATKRALAHSPGIRAFLLESSMLPPYAHAIQSATGLPVYDLTNAMDYLHVATHRQEYLGDY